MNSFITGTKEAITRIPWKSYLKSQFYKIMGLLFVAILIIAIMFLSEGITDSQLSTPDFNDPNYLLSMLLSSLCFFLVLFGFSKIVLFDMGQEFGLRNEDTKKMVFNSRFFLFAALALSFCASIYLLLDVFLQETYLQILPVITIKWTLSSLDISILNFTDLVGREFYQTARNVYFGFFFFIIIAFSIIVFLALLTTFARRRVSSRFKKEEKDVDEEIENRRLYKILAWIAIPFIGFYIIIPAQTISFAPVLNLIFSGMIIWWIYQVIKIIILILWRGFKITAFVTSVNFLLIIPLIAVLYVLPVIILAIRSRLASSDFGNLNLFMNSLIIHATDGFGIIQFDFVIITIVATFIVGFAEGFAVIAIFSAISRGTEVARTGRIIARSPPKVAVISKYLVMLFVWLGLAWDSIREVVQMLINEFNFTLPEIPSFFYFIYDRILIPMSDWFTVAWPTFKYVPLLLIPVFFIISGAFKFLSVTLITPRVKDWLSAFFLLVSTAFVLIITNILGDIYEINRIAMDKNLPHPIPDAPLISLAELEVIFSDAVVIFEYVEAIAFYGGLLFGIGWLIRKIIRNRRSRVKEITPEVTIQDLETKDVEETTSEIKEITPEVTIQDLETKDVEETTSEINESNVEKTNQMVHKYLFFP
ncbi:MAG: hypothetical protein ACXAC8_08350 [Candidatus Hodarchaeales archaeon]|jgi:hypothetical protein